MSAAIANELLVTKYMLKIKQKNPETLVTFLNFETAVTTTVWLFPLLKGLDA